MDYRFGQHVGLGRGPRPRRTGFASFRKRGRSSGLRRRRIRRRSFGKRRRVGSPASPAHPRRLSATDGKPVRGMPLRTDRRRCRPRRERSGRFVPGSRRVRAQRSGRGSDTAHARRTPDRLRPSARIPPEGPCRSGRQARDRWPSPSTFAGPDDGCRRPFSVAARIRFGATSGRKNRGDSARHDEFSPEPADVVRPSDEARWERRARQRRARPLLLPAWAHRHPTRRPDKSRKNPDPPARSIANRTGV